MNVITYKGYSGVFDYDREADIFHGEVAGVLDVITFQGRSIDELRQALADSVEVYLEICAEDDRVPEKPRSGSVSLRLGPELHLKAQARAKAAGMALDAYLVEAVGRAVDGT